MNINQENNLIYPNYFLIGEAVQADVIEKPINNDIIDVGEFILDPQQRDEIFQQEVDINDVDHPKIISDDEREENDGENVAFFNEHDDDQVFIDEERSTPAPGITTPLPDEIWTPDTVVGDEMDINNESNDDEAMDDDVIFIREVIHVLDATDTDGAEYFIDVSAIEAGDNMVVTSDKN